MYMYMYTYIYTCVHVYLYISHLPFPEGAVVLKPTFPSAGIAACHCLPNTMGVR